jgi:dolichol-phosphate mannosyltransferase
LKNLLILPTLNENNNIFNLIKKIKTTKLNLNILFIDDNSTDGTQNKIKSICRKNKKIKYIFRKNANGIGSAHKKGIIWAIKNQFDICITMDADGTHDPKLIKYMIKQINNRNFEIISTNRFSIKNSMKYWPLHRIFLTKLRYYLVSFFLNTKLDSSGGFRAYNLRKIKYKDFFISKNNSYFFLIESLFYFEKLKYKIKELPIKLNPRTYEKSKMKLKDILSSLINLVLLKINNIFN